MRLRREFLKGWAAVVLLGLAVVPAVWGQDIVYVGDGGTDTIKRFDATTGASLGEIGGGGLTGPRGMVVDGGELLVVNQNVNLPIPGEVLRYSTATGTFLGALIPFTDRNAPFAPDGIVLGLNDDLFVGNVTSANGTSHGELVRYASDGAFISASRAQGFQNKDFHVRGVVVGPDERIYVSCRSLKKDGLGGAVLRFNADGSFRDVFVDDDGGPGRLNRPDGLVFSPDGSYLCVTSFRAAPGDTDSIRIYDAAGALAGQIDLHNGTTDPRVFAQSLLFGPGGKLFVPVSTSGNPAASTGAIRRYNSPTTGDYSDLVTADSGLLLQPIYMTFGQTDPSTLEYHE